MTFEPELEAYEREAAKRLGPSAAHEARREMEAHLAADLAARLEMGTPPESAREQALAAFGDPRRIARAEPKDPSDVALALAPVLFLVGYMGFRLAVSHPSMLFYGPDLRQPNIMVGLPVVPAILAAVYAAGGRSQPNLRPLLAGWLVALGLAAGIMAVASPETPVATLATFGFWLGVPPLLTHVLAVRLVPLARKGELPGAGLLRLVAWPLGMLVVGNARVLSPLVPWAWPITGVLLVLGMIGRRRPALGTAVAATFLGTWLNGIAYHPP